MTEQNANEGWSTPKFFLILLVIDFVLTFTLNGVLNEVMHLGVSTAALGVAPSIVLIVLLPRWRWFRQRILKR